LAVARRGHPRRCGARDEIRRRDGPRRIQSDERTAAAVLHQIFLIGEAAARLPEGIRNRAPDIPWQEIIGMRNIIAHGYFEVDLEVPWKTVRLDLRPLQQQMRSLLESDEP